MLNNHGQSDVLVFVFSLQHFLEFLGSGNTTSIGRNDSQLITESLEVLEVSDGSNVGFEVIDGDSGTKETLVVIEKVGRNFLLEFVLNGDRWQ